MKVDVGVLAGVWVKVDVGVLTGVFVKVAVEVATGVFVNVAVGVFTGVTVGCGVLVGRGVAVAVTESSGLVQPSGQDESPGQPDTLHNPTPGQFLTRQMCGVAEGVGVAGQF